MSGETPLRWGTRGVSGRSHWATEFAGTRACPNGVWERGGNEGNFHTLPSRVGHAFPQARRRKFAMAGRHRQHAGRARSPEGRR
jgi:hypothetical protein